MNINTPYFPILPKLHISKYNSTTNKKYIPYKPSNFNNLHFHNLPNHSHNKQHFQNLNTPSIQKIEPTDKINSNFTINNPSILNIFGINLEFDDLLILGILFFLYIEGVKDQSLYIVLIILLLS